MLVEDVCDLRAEIISAASRNRCLRRLESAPSPALIKGLQDACGPRDQEALLYQRRPQSVIGNR